MHEAFTVKHKVALIWGGYDNILVRISVVLIGFSSRDSALLFSQNTGFVKVKFNPSAHISLLKVNLKL